jgi:signal transduction histidine kinase
MRLIYSKPALAVLWLGVASVLAGLLACWILLQQPWLGIGMRVSDAGDAILVSRINPALATAPPVGAQVLGLVSATGASIDLRATDLIEEPDFFDTYAQMADFFARQSALSALLHAGPVTLLWRDPLGAERQTLITPQARPLSDLPAMFWFQLCVGFSALLTAAWVFVLRPDYWGARLFALTGLAFPMFTTAAAIYSSRELALPGDLFRALSSLNHAGANFFGCALAGLFLMYPRPLVRARTLLWFPAAFGLWWLADALRWAPDQNWGSRLPIMAQLLMAIGFGLLQWRSSRRSPLDRAALRWFALSSLVGCSLFILTVYMPSMLGRFAPLPQGYAFGFFLLMYAGIALGLRKYRLFDLDEWAYRVWLWLVGVLAVVAMDAALLYVGMDQTLSLGATLLLCGGLYFPFRQWLWQRLLARQEPQIELLLPEISRIAFIASPDAQEAAWSALLRKLFDPLEMTACQSPVAHAEVREDGLLLRMPACASMAACSLRHAGRGARLFSSRDAQFATVLCHIMGEMMSGRTRYEQGVTQERLRIGRDLHDNIGARLLKMIHQLRGTPTADVARDAMKDLRTAIAALDSHPVPLPDALADWRAEAEGRCEALGCQLHWLQPESLPALELAPRTKATLEAVLREIITNALKHAAPSAITADIALAQNRLTLSIANDGTMSDPLAWKEGYGLRNIRGRLGEMGGSLGIRADARELRLTLEVALP